MSCPNMFSTIVIAPIQQEMRGESVWYFVCLNVHCAGSKPLTLCGGPSWSCAASLCCGSFWRWCFAAACHRPRTAIRMLFERSSCERISCEETEGLRKGLPARTIVREKMRAPGVCEIAKRREILFRRNYRSDGRVRAVRPPARQAASAASGARDG